MLTRVVMFMWKIWQALTAQRSMSMVLFMSSPADLLWMPLSVVAVSWHPAVRFLLPLYGKMVSLPFLPAPLLQMWLSIKTVLLPYIRMHLLPMYRWVPMVFSMSLPVRRLILMSQVKSTLQTAVPSIIRLSMPVVKPI